MKELTLIIPFLNEGEEVYNTVNSFLSSADIPIDIILINDASNDGYNYRKIAEEFGAKYIEHPERKGVAASREEGIELSESEYFLLLDAHMRTFQNDWASIILNTLKENNRTIFNCTTYPLNIDGSINKDIIERDHRGAGAYINLDNLGINWLTFSLVTNNQTLTIPCILGASYACNKTYWNLLNGLRGLRSYGLDEQFISIKAYLEGGNCKSILNVVFGHIFRESVESMPYKTGDIDYTFNKLFIAEVLFPSKNKIELVKNLRKTLPNSTLLKAIELLIQEKKEIQNQKEYYNKIFTSNFDRIVEYNINSNLDDLIKIKNL